MVTTFDHNLDWSYLNPIIDNYIKDLAKIGIGASPIEEYIILLQENAP